MPKSYFRSLLTFVFLIVLSQAGWAQPVRIGDQARVRVCNEAFFDRGGPNGDHSDPAAGVQSTTICSTNPGPNQSHVAIAFNNTNIAGRLRVYNGENAASPVLFDESDLVDEFFSVRATLANTSGCLTVQFESTGSGSGWIGAISCTRACQPIEAVVLSTVPAAEPDLSGYVDICPGDNVAITARGNYPENGIGYPQSDATSTFTWNFQNGEVRSGRGLTTVDNDFDVPGGYVVEVLITDTQGCSSTNQIKQRVRVAPPPTFVSPGDLPDPICVGEELSLTVGRLGDPGDVSFDPMPVETEFQTSQARTDTIPLPDRQGEVYTTPVTFSNFAPGQTITSTDDIVSVCAVVEHAFIGDLDIFLVCPSGMDTVFFLRYARFGEPPNFYRGQRLGDADRQSTSQDPPGRYCWTVDAPRSMDEYVRDFIDEDDFVRMPDNINYRPVPGFGFENIVGCPLNGVWTLNFEDFQSLDSGWSFSWEITFRSDLQPDQETFTVPVEDFTLRNFDNYTFWNKDTAVFRANNPGPNSIVIESTDDYGCSYDTSITIEVLSPFNPQCISCGPLVDRNSLDTVACGGESFTPEVAVNIASDTVIRYDSYPIADFGRSLYGSEGSAFLNTITVADFSPNRINNAGATVQGVCVDLENNGNLRDVTLELIAPNGRVITLLENFGGNGENLLQTCFSPTSTNPIGSSTAPYTGTFASAGGNWVTLIGSDINGDWQLRAYDRGGNDLGRLVRWSLDLTYDRDFTYSWTPVDGNLSCTDCPNPTITVSSPTTYTLNVTSATGCSDQATVNVTLNSLDVTVSESITEPTCFGTATGAIDLDVTGSEAAYFFSWSDNGSTDEDRTNLRAGIYTLTISDPDGCRDEFVYTLTDPPLLELTLESITDVKCFDGATGEIEVSTSGGTSPYTYLWDDPNAQNEEDAGALTVGAYNLVVTDANGCTANLAASVGQPDPLTIAFDATAVTCRDGNDGQATAIVTGGNDGYAYAWQTGATTPTITDLVAGTYGVTVTDAQGCTASGAVDIDQPSAPLEATASQDEQGCFGASANVATASGTGGTPPYTFLWSNGETTPQATGLPAGENTVTITDANGCTALAAVDAVDLEEIQVQLQLRLPTCNNSSDGRMAAAFNVRQGTDESEYTYLWSTGSTSPTIINVPGGVTYRVTVTGPRGCTGTGERFLPAPPPITFNVGKTPVVCAGESNGALTINNIDGPNGGPYTIQWGPGAGNSTSNSVSGLAAGNYRVIITGPENCVADTMLTVSEPFPVGLTAEVRNVSCFGESDGRVTIAGSGGIAPYRYAWSNGSSQPEIASLVAGTYTVTVTDANDCTYEEAIEVIQPDPVTASASAEDVLCMGDATGRVTVTPGGGRPPYLFGINNQTLTRNPLFIGLRAGVYEMTVRDSSGCRATDFVTVEDGPDFTVSLPDDLTIVFGDSVLIDPQVNGGVGDITYRWRGSYGGTLNCDSCTTVLAKPEYEIDYEIDLVDEDGCTAEDRFRVSVRKIREVQVPTGFSPNGDGRNDALIVHGRPGTRVLSYVIFDRWANVLYEASDFEVNDATAAWDGTSNGKLMNAGVYLYKLVIRYDDDSEEVLSGQTTLIR